MKLYLLSFSVVGIRLKPHLNTERELKLLYILYLKNVEMLHTPTSRICTRMLLVH